MPRDTKHAAYAYLHVAELLAVADTAILVREVHHVEAYLALYEQLYADERPLEAATVLDVYLTWLHGGYLLESIFLIFAAV